MEKKSSAWENIPDILQVLFLYVAGIISVGAMYFLLTGVDQGIDVVIQAGEQVWSGILSIVTVALWAYLVWYSCRLLSYAKQCRETKISVKLLQLLPRLLAYNCFVCVQVSIFSLPTFCKFSFWQILAFVLVQNVYYYILHQWFGHKKTFARIVGWLGILVAAAVYIVWAFNHRNDTTGDTRHEFWLPLVGLAMFISQVLLVYYFFRRRRRIDEKAARPENHQADETKKGIGRYINSWYAGAEKQDIRYFRITSIIALVIYLFAIFSIPVADEMGPMAFVMLALGVLVGFSNLISFVSIRIRINVFFFIFLFAIFIGKFYDPYNLRQVDVPNKNFFAARPTVKAYLYKWAKKREALLSRYDSTHRFPIYLVLSDGGASRAGNWVCSVLSSLQDSSAKYSPGDLFCDHILAIAGASGGSVGNSAFYSMLRARRDSILKGPFSPHSTTFFDGDFLTFTLARLFGPDMFRHIVPIRIMDRGAALESVLATGTPDPIIDTQLSRPLSQVFDTSGDLPILFITTTRVQDGMPCIISPTQLPKNSQRKDVTKLLEPGRDIRFATAAILSSRFPYVSPAGDIKENYFVDGGYVDNAGSGIMLDFLESLEEFATDTTDKSDTTQLLQKFKHLISFHVIHIYNSPDDTAVFSRINPLTNDMITPVLTLAGMQGSSTLIYTATLEQYFRTFNKDTANAVINYSLYREPETDTAKREDPYPMSWVISSYQLKRMHDRLVQANKENGNKFWFLPQIPTK